MTGVSMIPAERAEQFFAVVRRASVPCAHCGKHRSQHRYETDECPNPAWKPGNGRPHWWNQTYERAYA